MLSRSLQGFSYASFTLLEKLAHEGSLVCLQGPDTVLELNSR